MSMGGELRKQLERYVPYTPAVYNVDAGKTAWFRR
jgi:hypothetical protein